MQKNPKKPLFPHKIHKTKEESPEVKNNPTNPNISQLDSNLLGFTHGDMVESVVDCGFSFSGWLGREKGAKFGKEGKDMKRDKKKRNKKYRFSEVSFG